MLNNNNSMEKIITLCKNRGFVFAGSEIYGGLANTWDYGPLGMELKKNIKDIWWKTFVTSNTFNVGIDSAILMNPKVWVTSGHVSSFSDPLMDCKNCKTRHRADKLIEENANENPGGWTFEMMENFIKENELKCPQCNSQDFTSIRNFNLMFKTSQGIIENSKNEIYLRPETAQGIFINFLNVQRSSRMKIPFGICQIGKSFRNEITPGNFTFRTREFEQMELEFFCKPDTDSLWFEKWKNYCLEFLLNLNIKKDSLKLRNHENEELAHYAKQTVDIEFSFPFGWGELWGIANRTDFDLKSHSNESGKSLEYFDPSNNEHFIPYVIEPSLGVDRLTLAILCDAYTEEKISEDDKRTVLKLHPMIAPFKAAILPLSKKLGDKSREIQNDLCQEFSIDYDESGSIGKRYRRQDEIGTPFCITVDFETENDNCVTIRNRDNMSQIRIKINDIKDYIRNNTKFKFTTF